MMFNRVACTVVMVLGVVVLSGPPAAHIGILVCWSAPWNGSNSRYVIGSPLAASNGGGCGGEQLSGHSV